MHCQELPTFFLIVIAFETLGKLHSTGEALSFDPPNKRFFCLANDEIAH